MTRTFARLCIAVLLGAPLLLGSAPVASADGDGSTTGPDTPAGASRATEARVAHRVVWDQFRAGRSGIHLRSARPDGTDVRNVYDAPAGFTTELTLSRDGRRVAFATCCRDSFPPLVVVPARGGRVVTPLAHHPRIYIVGGIGWSPDGTRIAFEGTVAAGRQTVTSLWTIRPDGTDLRRIVTLTGGGSFINRALAWTRAGILYSDGNDLRSARAGRTHLVLRHVDSVRISGDGRRIITRRLVHGILSYWVGRPDGTSQRRILDLDYSGQGTWFSEVTPSYDSSSVLAFRETRAGDGEPDIDQVVTWPLHDDPSSARTLGFLGGNSTVTWN